MTYAGVPTRMRVRETSRDGVLAELADGFLSRGREVMGPAAAQWSAE